MGIQCNVSRKLSSTLETRPTHWGGMFSTKPSYPNIWSFCMNELMHVTFGWLNPNVQASGVRYLFRRQVWRDVHQTTSGTVARCHRHVYRVKFLSQNPVKLSWIRSFVHPDIYDQGLVPLLLLSDPDKNWMDPGIGEIQYVYEHSINIAGVVVDVCSHVLLVRYSNLEGDWISPDSGSSFPVFHGFRNAAWIQTQGDDRWSDICGRFIPQIWICVDHHRLDRFVSIH